MRILPVVVVIAALALVAVACGSGDDLSSDVDPSSTVTQSTTSTTSTTTTTAPDPLRLNDLRVLGSHNSYHQRPEPDVYAVIEALSPALAESIDYSHASLTEQLESHGIRQFELDVFADPDGGHYANRQALPVIGVDAASGLPELDEPGFKVIHTQDFDFGTNCLTLVLCLTEIRDWSDANPDHLPVMIMIELKEESIVAAAAALGLDISDIPIDWTVPLLTTESTLDDLDEEILSVFSVEHVIVPDDVRGNHATLEEAVLADEWPTLDESRGQVLFGLVNTGSARELYRAPSDVLAGRVMFTSSEPGSPDAAFLRIDDPIEGADRIAELAAAGYLIRTRTDTPTGDARTGSTERRDAAIASGAHYLSTDYYEPDPAFGTGYQVKLDDRCNPVTAPTGCDLSS